MKIQTIQVVRSSELFEGLGDDVWEEISEELGRHVTWGDADKTLIGVGSIYQLGLDENMPKLVRDRLDTLPHEVYIDLEN